MKLKVNNKHACFLGLFLLFTAALLPAFGGKEKAAPVQDRPVQVSGVVRLVGSGHFPELVISGPEGGWYIAKEDADKLKELQHQTVTVEGIETVRELKFANGMPAGRRRELRDIKIISTQ